MRRPEVNWVKKIVYRALQILVLIAVRIYYRDVQYINQEKLKLDRPTILVSNHPSTMMDPVTIAAQVNRYVHFLANAGLFQTKFTNWFFSTFFCFPVQRKKDVGKIKIDNAQSFQRSFEFLRDGGCLYIAPEGISTPEHDLKPIKSGTARIALGTEQAFDYEVGLQILPIGIYYSDAQTFRSKILMNVGDPIVVAKHKNAFENNARNAVHELTAELQEKMEAALVTVDGKEQDEFLRRIEKLINAKHPVSLIDQYKRTQKFASATQSGLFEKIAAPVNHLFSQIKKNDLTPEGLMATDKKRWGLILFPLAILGLLVNSIPLLIIKGIEKTANLYVGYTTTVRVLMGIIFLPIGYRLNHLIASSWIDVGYWWPLLWVVYLALGLIAYRFFNSAGLYLNNWKWKRLQKTEEGKLMAKDLDDILATLSPYI